MLKSVSKLQPTHLIYSFWKLYNDIFNRTENGSEEKKNQQQNRAVAQI